MKEQPTQTPPASASSACKEIHVRKYKFFNIIVNGRMKLFDRERISCSGIVALAFNDAAAKKCESFSITYQKGAGNKPEGTMMKGDSVAVKPGMIFYVEPASKS